MVRVSLITCTNYDIYTVLLHIKVLLSHYTIIIATTTADNSDQQDTTNATTLSAGMNYRILYYVKQLANIKLGDLRANTGYT